VLAFIGIVSLAGGLMLTETLPKRYTGTLLQSIRRLGVVLKNPGFTSLLIVFSLVSMASLAFISDSSYIYENGFGLSEQWFSFYFATNALAMISGPLLYLRLSRSFSRKQVIMACFWIMIAGGILICLFGSRGAIVFTLALFPATLMGSCVRSPGAFLMLGQQREDTGSASALINCAGLLFGSAGILIASIDESHLILVLGLLYAAVGFLCLSGWLLIGRLKIAKEVPDIAGVPR